MDRSTDPSPSRTVSLLINRSFALLWTGQGISFLGDAVFNTTAVLWIATRVGRGEPWAPAAVGALLLAQMVPEVAFGPFAGVFVDRWQKKRVMLAMDAARAGLIGLLILVSGLVPALPSPTRGVELGAIYAAIFLITVCSQFFAPARLAVLADIVPDEQRERAGGLAQINGALASILGPSLAAPLFFAAGPSWSLGLDALSFLVSFGTILPIQAPPSTRDPSVEQRRRFLREFLAGVRLVGSNQVLRTVVVTGVVIMLGGGAINALYIFFVQQNLHTSPRLFGVLEAAQGAGMLTCAALAGVFAERLGARRLFWSAALLFGALFMVYSRLTSFLPGLLLIFLIGGCISALQVAAGPLVIRATPRDFLGRVASLLNPSFSLATTLSAAAAGWLASTLLRGLRASLLGMAFGPVDTIFLGAGVLALAGGVYAMLGLREAAAVSTGDTDVGSVAKTAG